MRKIVILGTSLLIIMALCACGKQGGTENESGSANNMLKDVSFTPKSDDGGMNGVSYVKVSELDEQYLTQAGGVTYVSALEEHIEIGGLTHPNKNGGEYFRLDTSMKGVYMSECRSESFIRHASQTSGGTLRFCTNAPEIVLKVTMREVYPSEKSAPRGIYGFDVYTGSGTARNYCGANMQLMCDTSELEETIALPGGYIEVMINLPLYGGVQDISIGFPEGAEIGAPTARTHKPICFYGSSITQGANASRPGNAYTNMVCRMLNADCKNLGFSSSARGEEFVAEYIAEQELSAFVMDYDHNSSLEELTECHYNFYKIVRESQPDLPIILISKPCYLEEATDEMLSRIAVIEGTYKKAVEEGDENIYFINGSEFFPQGMREAFSADTTHPNDAGMYYMAMSVYEVLDSILNK